MNPSDQILYLLADARRAVNGRWWRWISVVWSPAFASIAGYRLSRAAYLGMGRWRPVVHTLLAPVRMLLRPLGGGLEIHYKADIGPASSSSIHVSGSSSRPASRSGRIWC